MSAQHDVIVIGSGAGGGSVAYKLANSGKRVLLIEKGPFLERDKSTLEVRQVFVDGVCDYRAPGQGKQKTVSWLTYVDGSGGMIVGGAPLPPPPPRSATGTQAPAFNYPVRDR